MNIKTILLASAPLLSAISAFGAGANRQHADEQQRKLDWVFINHIIPGHDFYTWYYDDEVPSDYNDLDDEFVPDDPDYLRDTDLCYDGRTNTYTRENCNKLPDLNCDNIEEELGSDAEFGPAKLCINRVPFPTDFETFYILAMKCIPMWENCDKCMCGVGDHDKKANDASCTYDEEATTPDDDRIEIRVCDSEDLSNINVRYGWMTFEAESGQKNFDTIGYETADVSNDGLLWESNLRGGDKNGAD